MGKGLAGGGAQRSGAETVLCPCYSPCQTFLQDMSMLATLHLMGGHPWSCSHCPL